MTELWQYTFKTLEGDGEFLLAQGIPPDGKASILVLSTASGQQTPASIAKLEHAYALRSELNGAWAARPFELMHHHEKSILLMEHPGGELLATMLGKPWPLTQFLRVAIGMAVSLGRLHEHGFVHKDIKPSNILVDRITGESWLTGFGIASRHVSQQPTPEPPSVIAGTLPYMAPEQTGRMNRSIDSRSDLYAFGVTLYEMLTGALPFTAADPMEWVHCHVARHPVPVHERIGGIPLAVSAIISKLMAKNAEDRYQTAAGVELDLRNCLSEWGARGRVDPFPLGRRDVPDRLLIPEKLYGRESEVNRLIAAFDRVSATGATEVVLIAGTCGVGKSSVVNELHKALVPPRGLLASGKCEPCKQNIPYAVLGQAFRSLVLRVLSQSDAELDHWRALLQDAMGVNAQLFVNLIPEIELIIGKQSPVPNFGLRDLQSRFQGICRSFLSVFARPGHPLALFLEDMQWMDAATLELLEHLLTEPGLQSLLLIGAYRAEETRSSHPLLQTLERIRAAELAVDEMVLAPLQHSDIADFIVDSLHCEYKRAEPLAALVFQKTAGNPFFVIQFLRDLVDEGMVVFNPRVAAWTWDLDCIQEKDSTENVADLMIGKLNRLPEMTREVLKSFACFGISAETQMLGMIHGLHIDAIHAALRDAVRDGIVFERDRSSYAFVHNRIQEAVYALIPGEERRANHLAIGRLLAVNAGTETCETIFEIVGQLNRGIALIDSLEERERVAELNMLAANRAKVATAYVSSLSYLAIAESLLAEDRWSRCHQLSFSIEFSQAECEVLTGDLSTAEKRLSTLANRISTLDDRATVTRLRIALYTTLDRFDRGVDVGLEYLRHLGGAWSSQPTDEEVQTECDRMWQLLGGRAIEELIDLPLMTDPGWRTAMDVLTEIIPAARLTGGNLQQFLLLRMTNLSLEHGNCDGSCCAYASLISVLGERFHDYQTSFRFGKVGFDLVEKRGLDKFKARVYLCFSMFATWTNHATLAREWIRRANEAAAGSGDLNHVAFGRRNLVTNLLFSGLALEETKKEAEHGLIFSKNAQFRLIVDCFIAQLILIHTLRDLAPDFAFIDGESGDLVLANYEQHLVEQHHFPFSACCHWIYKLQALFVLGDYAAALETAAKAQNLLWVTRGIVEIAEYHFYAALARAAAADGTTDDQRQAHIDALSSHHQQLVVWAENCPENFLNRSQLVAAEIARLDGREWEAAQLYEEAIRLTREHGFIQNEALANELASRFYSARGFETTSHAYLRNARRCYVRWGANRKVQQLDRSHPHLREKLTVPAHTSMISEPVEHLDLAEVIRVSQAVSGEIVLENLIQVLMRIAVRHAGAERALLILSRDDEHQVEAEASTSQDGIEVHYLKRKLTPSDLPETVFKYVMRTQERVILDDALAPNLFSSDGYIAQQGIRSILCLPLVKQAMVVGALYLENATTSFVFTPGRVEVLQLLTSQAAISLENARLYTDLQASEDHLRLVIDTIPAMVWSNAPDGSVETVNQRVSEYTGFTLEQSIADGWQAFVHPDDSAGLKEARNLGIAEGRPYHYEYRMRRKDGEYRYILARSMPLRNAEGKVVQWYGSAIDIEDHKRAEEALQSAFVEIKELKDQLYRENVALKEEIERSSMFEEIIGASSALKAVLSRLAKVAPTDSTVLITGETGTGKELIARAIHKASLRSERAFVSVNCAAIPQSLIASELFGHEKGAFTGAQQRRLGRFEVADEGTIFLDEVGELPAETQVALLRVLQEREFERVGGNRLIQTNTRVITATNRSLQDAIHAGTFRSDLFYRLNVFPIAIPPLRERKDDIPMLVEYFIDRFSKKTGKRFRKVNRSTLDRLLSYSWPGNIRELQNVIERSLIICETEDFTIDESWLDVGTGSVATTERREKEIIETALAECGGKVSGSSGAAAKLNMPASTLDYKIRVLKINKHRFKAR